MTEFATYQFVITRFTTDILYNLKNFKWITSFSIKWTFKQDLAVVYSVN